MKTTKYIFFVMIICLLIIIFYHKTNYTSNSINEKNIENIIENNTITDVKIEYSTSKEKINSNKNNLIKNESNKIQYFNLIKTFSKKELFEIKLLSKIKIGVKNFNKPLRGIIKFNEINDFFEIYFDNKLDSKIRDLYIEIKYKNKSFFTNAFKLLNLNKDLIYFIELTLIDDYIEINHIELGNKLENTKIQKLNIDMKKIQKTVKMEVQNANFNITQINHK